MIKKIKEEELIKLLNKFRKASVKNGGMRPKERYSSFDYCFNYFQSFKNKKEIADVKNLEASCLHLGFYLASWGMLRGSSFLLEKSIAYLKDIISFIANFNQRIWNIDLEYSEEDIEILLSFKNKLIKRFGNDKNKFSDTLITKIMLGVFGNVPAYDNYFKIFLKDNNYDQTFNKKSLEGLNDLYEENRKLICRQARNTKTFNFISEKKSDLSYTRAKIIDMIGFSYGQINSK